MTYAIPLFLAAVTKVLAPFAPDSWSPDPLPPRFETQASSADLAAFARVDAVVASSRRRHDLWNRYLELMHMRESQPCTASVRFRMSVGGRIYLFTDRGRLFLDGRFVKEDEVPALLAAEDAFLRTLSASPYGKVFKVRAEAPFAEIDASVGTIRVPGFHGFEDARYQRHDAAIARVSAETERTDRPLPAAILKSLLVETRCWDFDSRDVDESYVRAVARELAGFAEEPFSGWEPALMAFAGRNSEAEVGRRYRADFAARVVSRAINADAFVPAVGRTSKQQQEKEQK